MVLGKIICEGVKIQCRYYKDRTTWLITAAKGGTDQEGDSHFNDMKQGVKKPSRKGRIKTSPCISKTTCRLADQREKLGRKLTANQRECRAFM